MTDRIDWGTQRAAHQVPFERTVTLAASTGIVFGAAPTLPASVWTEMDPGFCLRDIIVYGDASSTIRVSVDSAHAARLGDERCIAIAAGKSHLISGPVGKVAIWNPEGAASVTVGISGQAIRQGNDTGSYTFATWPITCDDADIKCDSSVVTCDATFMP